MRSFLKYFIYCVLLSKFPAKVDGYYAKYDLKTDFEHEVKAEVLQQKSSYYLSVLLMMISGYCFLTYYSSIIGFIIVEISAFLVAVLVSFIISSLYLCTAERKN